MTIFYMMVFSFQSSVTLLVKEEVTIQVGAIEVDNYLRNLYIYKQKLRVNYPRENISLIYDLDMHTLYVVEMDKQRFFLARAGDGKLSRRPLTGLVRIKDGLLERPPPDRPMAVATGALQNISGFRCTEYRLNYPTKLGVDVQIWSGRPVRPTDIDRKYRRVWAAAFGTRLPPDVVTIHKDMLTDIKGIPIKTITTFVNDGLAISTTVTVKSLRRLSTIDENIFEIPDNFTYADKQAEDRPWMDY